MTDFDMLLQKAVAFHGETCPGIVMGTRMSIAGLQGLNIDPYQEKPDIFVYAEIDRCTTDAIQAITGVSLGRRTLKYVNYGKFAATFLDLKSKKAVRVALRLKWPKQVQDLKEFGTLVRTLPQEELFRIDEVQISLSPTDMPGFPTRVIACSRCGEEIMDGREVIVDGASVCKKCAHDSYYTIITP